MSRVKSARGRRGEAVEMFDEAERGPDTTEGRLSGVHMYVHVRVERAHPLPVVAETSCQPHSSCSLDFQCNSNREEKVGPQGVGGLRRLQPQLSHTNSTHYLSPQSSDREEEKGVSKAGTASGTSRQTRMVVHARSVASR